MSPTPEFAHDHDVRLYQGAQELFPALVEAMDAALSDIQFETYIFDFTGAGSSVGEALARAAQRGVRTHLVVDGVGTGRLPALWAARLTAAGVQWRVYSPLGRLGLLLPSRWRRLHRKLCVVDHEHLFCGGINILDDYHDHYHGPLSEPRFDLAVQVRGPIVHDAITTMAQLWWRMQAAREVRQRRLPDALETLRHGMGWREPGTGALTHVGTATAWRQGARAALLLRDNVRHRTRIEKAYLRAIGTAREEVIIANAYFLPGRKLRKALVLAAGRGVRVQLLLQGKYEGFMQYHASRPVYRTLLEAGVDIHEYSPSFLHAKVAVVDRHWSTVGSSNLDPLSLLLAREANVVVEDASFAQVLRQRLLHAMSSGGLRMDPLRYASRPWHERVLDRVAYALMRLALFLTGKRY